jgi:hypothetical protein
MPSSIGDAKATLAHKNEFAQKKKDEPNSSDVVVDDNNNKENDKEKLFCLPPPQLVLILSVECHEKVINSGNNSF